VVALDAFDQFGDRGGVLMVDDERRAGSSGRGDQLTRFLDRLGAADFGRSGAPAATPCRVDEEAGTSEFDRDRPAGTAGCACDERDPGI
jgi:hypothetical protein